MSGARLLFAAVLVGVLARRQLASARLGVDVSVETTPEVFPCLQAAGMEFVIPRVYRNVGKTDPIGAQTMAMARAQTPPFSFVDGYIFPCIQSSAYSQANNITCPTAEQQVMDTLSMLEAQPGALPEPSGAPLRLWLDVEDENPSKYYDSDVAVNQKALAELAAALSSKQVDIGIYTTKTYWAQIMGNQLGYGIYPLWYPRYDANNSMGFFAPFADFKDVFIKQTGGDLQLCGVRYDPDYML